MAFAAWWPGRRTPGDVDKALEPAELAAEPAHRHLIVRYGFAFAVTAAAVGVRSVLSIFVPGLAPFATFFPAVLAATLVGGLGPGLMSTALSAICAWWLWLEPAGGIERSGATAPVDLVLFVGACLALLAAAQAARRYHARSLATERRFRAAEDLALDGFAMLETVRDRDGAVADFTWTYANPPLRRMLGIDAHEVAGRRLSEHPQGHLAPRLLSQRCARVVESGQAQEEEVAYETDGRRGWFRTDIVKLNGGIALSLRDVTGRKEREDALKESEERFRLLADAVDDVFWIIDPGRQKVVYVSPAYEHVWGFSRDALYRDARAWRSHLHPEDHALADPAFDEMLTGRRESFELVYRLERQDGTLRWVRDKAWRARAGAIERVVGIMSDITAEKAAEEKQRLLTSELEHRLRNTFALVHSVLRLSARSADDMGTFVATLEARLQALSRGQELVTIGLARLATLEEVVRETLAPYAGEEDRIRLIGPEVRIEIAAVPLLHMAFHELATNAAKYGALSVPRGRVSVRWERSLQDRSPMLRLVWREGGGPIVVPPKRRGFGSDLVEHALAMELRGEIKFAFVPEGITCTMFLPLSKHLSIGGGSD